MEKYAIKLLKNHIDDVIKKNTYSPTTDISHTVAPYISFAIVSYIAMAFIPATVYGYLSSWFATGGIYILKHKELISKNVPGNVKELKAKIIEYFPASLKQKLDNNIGNVVDSILQTWGSDEYLEEYFKPEEKFPGMWWYVQKVVTLLNSVNKDVSGKLQKLLDKDDIVSAIINEYLKNTVEKKRRIQLSQMFKVTPPSSIIVRKTPLTIKDTFPPYIINTCDWFKNKSFYQALFGEPILVKLHLLVWFINLPNHLKISFYFDYDYEKEI